MITKKNVVHTKFFYFSSIYENFFFCTNFHKKKKLEKYVQNKNKIIKIYFKIHKKIKMNENSKNISIKNKNNFFFDNFVVIEQIYFFFSNFSSLSHFFSKIEKPKIIFENLVFFNFYLGYIKSYFLFVTESFLQKIFFDTFEAISKGFVSVFVYFFIIFFYPFFCLNFEKNKNLEELKIIKFMENFSKKKNYLNKELLKKKKKFFTRKQEILNLKKFKFLKSIPFLSFDAKIHNGEKSSSSEKNKDFLFADNLFTFLFSTQLISNFPKEKFEKHNSNEIHKKKKLNRPLSHFLLEAFIFDNTSWCLGVNLTKKKKNVKKKKFFFVYFPINLFKINFFEKLGFLEDLENILKVYTKILFVHLFSFFLDMFYIKISSSSYQKSEKLWLKNLFLFSKKMSKIISHLLISSIPSITGFLEYLGNFDIRTKIYQFYGPVFFEFFLKKSNFSKFFKIKKIFVFLEESIFFFVDFPFKKKFEKTFLNKIESFMPTHRLTFKFFKKKKFLDIIYKYFDKTQKQENYELNWIDAYFFFDKYSDFIDLGIFFNRKFEKSVIKEMFKDIRTASFSLNFFLLFHDMKKEKNNFIKVFSPLNIFRSLRLYSRFFFLNSNSIKNLNWSFNEMKYFVRCIGSFCKEKKNFFFFADFVEIMLICALNNRTSLLYGDFSSFLGAHMDRFTIHEKYFFKMGLFKKFPNDSSNLIIFEKNFKPKNKITNSLIYEDKNSFKEKALLNRELDGDHINLVQAIVVRKLKIKKFKKIDVSIVDTKKIITISTMDPRGLKIQMEYLCIKNFIAFSKERNKVKYCH